MGAESLKRWGDLCDLRGQKVGHMVPWWSHSSFLTSGRWPGVSLAGASLAGADLSS